MFVMLIWDANDHSCQVSLQVMLQPRCLLLMRGQACSSHTHSIASQDSDVVSAYCSNLQAAQVHVGQTVHRAQRRVSLVFVHKQHASWQY